MKQPIRVLVVDDSAVFRRLLTHIFNSDPALSVIGEASDGAEAIELVQELNPDVVTMDMHMPRMDGAQATAQIMQVTPRPIIIISASVDPKDVAQSFRAVELGAVSILAKPPGPASPEFEAAAADIVKTVKLLSHVKVVRHRSRPARREPAPLPRALDRRTPPQIVAIGASTGGPSALAQVLGALPADFNAPIVVVQHIATGFDQGLVDWLDRTTPLQVRLATPDSPLSSGSVLVAPCEKQLSLTQRRTFLDDGAPVDGHQPSITHMFRSVARSFGGRAVGVLLTGMGADGASGLLELKRAGSITIAQDQSTSVVYGMAQQAERLGAVDQILPLTQIADTITRYVDVSRS